MSIKERIEFKIIEKDAQIIFHKSRQALINNERAKQELKPKFNSNIKEFIYAASQEKKFWEEKLELMNEK